MSLRKLLRIAVCALAIPTGASLGGCTQQEETEAAMLIIGGITIGAIIALIASSNKSNASPTASAGLPSDARLKMNITPVAVLPNGLMLYSFQYRRDPTTTYVGVLAQDLLKSENAKFRDAVVVTPSGYYTVNYDQLGLRMFTLDEWRTISAEICRLPKATCSFVQTGIRIPTWTNLVSVAH